MYDSNHVVCPRCDAVNRIPLDRGADSAKCGRCHKPLFDGRPVPVDEGRFDRFIAKNDVPVLVDFWAEWCGPCRMMAPEFEKAAAMLSPNVRLIKVDTEAAPRISAAYGIRSIPSLVLFHRGKEIARTAGAQSASQLVNWVKSRLP